jgi:hypothetical protein
VECGIDVLITLRTVPSLNSLGSYCCRRIWPRVNSDPSSLDVPEHMISAYPQVFG